VCRDLEYVNEVHAGRHGTLEALRPLSDVAHVFDVVRDALLERRRPCGSKGDEGRGERRATQAWLGGIGLGISCCESSRRLRHLLVAANTFAPMPFPRTQCPAEEREPGGTCSYEGPPFHRMRSPSPA